MNITFLFGNGFDRQLGLRTSYSDFLETYVKELPSDTETIREFKQYLKSEKGKEYWSDAEIAMGKHLGEYSDETIDKYTECIENFENSMAEYLDREQARCEFKINEEKISRTFTDFLENSFRDVLNNRAMDFYDVYNNKSVDFRLLTLNYTLLLEKMTSHISNPFYTKEILGGRIAYRIQQICHLHGELNSQIIMGVNDESQLDFSGGIIPSEEIAIQMIKPMQNEQSGARRDLLAQQILERSEIIAIYGVSYGITDAKWWGIIQKWLRTDMNNRLVIFVRDFDTLFNRRLIWPEIKYEARKRKEILGKLGVTENDLDYGTLSKQIYIVLNTQRLNLKELLFPSKELRQKAAMEELEREARAAQIQEKEFAKLQALQSDYEKEMQRLQ